MAKRKQINFSQARRGHLRWCEAAGYSPNTIDDYERTHGYFADWLDDDLPLQAITSNHVEEFLRYMRQKPPSTCHGATNGRKPRRPRTKRSNKTLANYHIGLSSLWTWATKHGYADEHVVSRVARPKVHPKPIQPLTADEVIRLIRACKESRPWHNKPLTTTSRPTAERDRAIVAVLVETAIRASELCDLIISDVSWQRGGGQLLIRDGKGGKSRVVPFRRRAANYLNEWLMMRDAYHDHDPLFITLGRNEGLPMTRDNVGKLIRRLGKRVGVKTSPHHLRTTAACLMAANGMTAFELQRIMGHSDISTTMRYVRAAQINLDEAMREASPLDHLRL